MKAYSNWGTTVNAQGESAFGYVRNLARFESVRTDILDGDYAQALYSVFLLEKEFPQSVYLQQIKAQAWLGIARLKEAGKLNEMLPAASTYEGESSALYYFLHKLNNQGAMALATRTIYDTRQRFPEDTVLGLIRDKLILTLAKTEKFSWSDYSDRNFHESAEARLAVTNTDTTTGGTAAPGQSKYEKIRSKKNVKSPESFDSSKFYLYGLTDILADSVFREKFTTCRQAEKELKEQREAQVAMNRNKKKKKGPDYAAIPPMDLNKVLVVEPSSSCIHAEKGPVWALKSRSETMMAQALAQAAVKQGVEVVQVQRSGFEVNPEVFNQRSILYGLVEQSSVVADAEIVPVDYDLLKSIERSTGTSNILFSYSNYYYEPQLDGFFFLYCIVFPPALFYIPFAVKQSHKLETYVLVMDVTTGKVRAVVSSLEHGQPAKSRYSKVYLSTLKRLSLPQ